MPRFYADLHVHSRFSRATSRDCDLEHLAFWAGRKGISVLGTGDFTHPAWLAEIREKLAPAEPGLFRLREDIEQAVARRPGASCRLPTRFLLSVEISTIYAKGGRTRKVHHLVYVPDLQAAERAVRRLSRIGNLASDGRPILGLDSRDLLEVVLESSPGAYLVPAHAWTPWFSVLGSKAGFDAVEACYGDLARHVFAIETGLSSDPPMNWRISALDRYRLVSNSDAHSPAKLGREACAFDTELDYFAMRAALEGGVGYAGTVEFFPEEGKYHLDGHRSCGVRLSPAETRQAGGICPACGKPVTVGVMHRVEDLADRPAGVRPAGAAPFRSLVPLCEVLAEIEGTGSGSRAVERAYEKLLAQLGPELFVLEHAPVEEIRRAGSPLVAEAISRMREGRVIREAGFDGEYGVIRLFTRDELARGRGAGLLFPSADPSPSVDLSPPMEREAPLEGAEAPPPAPAATRASPLGSGRLSGLDPEQRAAAGITTGPLLVVAGPGTGKTRTLTHRIARLVADRRAAPEQCLAVTFTRRAADEMRERLAALLPGAAERVPVTTFHALGLAIVREHGGVLGLPPGFRVAGERERAGLLAQAVQVPERRAERLLARISRMKRTGCRPAPGTDLAAAFDAYGQALRAKALVDFDDLAGLAVEILEAEPELAARYREHYPWVSIDEYQDIDELQYRLVKRLVPPDGNVCAIGDPDQAIYGFRGADVRFFLRFQEDFPGARVVRLTRNYRSGRVILDASLQVISRSALAGPRALEALFEEPGRIVIHEAATERAEAEFVVHTIEQVIGGSTFFSVDSRRADPGQEAGCSFSDFAVLYRTEAQAGALCEAFSRSGMPFQKRSHGRLSDQPAVEAIVRAMRGMTATGPVIERLRTAAARVREATGGADGPAAAVDLLTPLAERCGEDGDRFLSELATGAEVDAWDPRADRVSLLTLHAVKGLEFRVVFIVGCEDGLLPLRWGGAGAAPAPSPAPIGRVPGRAPGSPAVEEDRRLLYVGMTRARERLFLSHARRRLWRGESRDAAPSPFLRDIEERLLERLERRGLGGRPAPRRAARQIELF